jgi:hypothetical protein
LARLRVWHPKSGRTSADNTKGRSH